jgi:hypothetical protein
LVEKAVRGRPRQVGGRATDRVSVRAAVKHG